MKVRLTEEAKQVIFPLICDGKIVMHSPETLLEALQMYDKMYGKAKRKAGFWQGFGITMTVGAVVFAKRWCDERRKTEMLEDELAFAKDDIFFEEDEDGGNS